jgi:acyl-CoA dehydrogenase
VGQQRSRSHRAPAILAATPRYLNARAFSIMGGTSEIQTNILAKALVGL